MREPEDPWSADDPEWADLSELRDAGPEAGGGAAAWPGEASRSRPVRPRRSRPTGGVWRSTDPDAPLPSADLGAPRPDAPDRRNADPAADGDAAAGRNARAGQGSDAGRTGARRRGASRQRADRAEAHGAASSGRTAARSARSAGGDSDPSAGAAERGTGAPATSSATSGPDPSAVDGAGAGRGGRKRSGRRERSGQDGSEQTPEALARDVVYRQLAVRARSRAELRQTLLRKEIPEDVADAVLQKFVDANLVNDAEFAESWVQERQRNQGLGRKALGYELRRKGVDESLVAEALSTLDSDAEEERARELVRRKLRSGRAEDPAKVLRRLVGMLARKGYSEGLAFRVAKEELERRGTAPDDDLDTP